MGPFTPLDPLSVTKRASPSKNISRQNRYQNIDLEKHEYSDDSDDDSDCDSADASESSPISSRETSGSYSSTRPMLRRKQAQITKRQAMYKLPDRIVRYLCLALISTLVIFMLSLVRMSVASSKRIEIGDIGSRPPPPPEPWNQFQFLSRYYGGLRTLVPFADNRPEYPSSDDELPLPNTTSSTSIRELPTSRQFMAYENLTTETYLAEHETVRECFLDAEATIKIPQLHYYEGRPSGFPDHVMGSYELIGLPENICFERYGRLGPYGLGYGLKYGGTGAGQQGDTEGSENVWTGRDSEVISQVDYGTINWGEAQKRCYDANSVRFNSTTSVPNRQSVSASGINDHTTLNGHQAGHNSMRRLLVNGTRPALKYTPRTAVVIRTWDDFEYGAEDILHLRAMITELSLGSGAEYDVHLLVQVKDEAKHPIWADSETYASHLAESVPEEFRGIATLWSTTQMLMLYQGIFDTFARGPDLPVHGPYRGLQMAMQYFAQKHPEYDFFWHWEIDIRYTGHYYDFFSKVNAWTQKQPRKGLWERNSRFYVPSVHGSWDDFKHMVRVQTEMGTESADTIWSGIKGAPKISPKGDKPIWGAERPVDPNDWFEVENDPEPPTSHEKDKYVWGVGEDADLITFNPLFDPEGTTWELAKDITGYNATQSLPPRRAAIVASSRMSRRLLDTMHRETAFKKHHAFSEMWAPTAALHHGYKAVYVPHPMFVDREWPTAYLAGIMNSGRNGASGGARTSVFGEREHNLRGMTWYYNAGFAPNLWKRWLGLRVNNEGGEEFELSVNEGRSGKGVNEMKGGEGRMCLPPMLLHPVKGVDLPVEGRRSDDETRDSEIPESDPSA